MQGASSLPQPPSSKRQCEQHHTELKSDTARSVEFLTIASANTAYRLGSHRTPSRILNILGQGSK